jgi:hypothetical protein
VFGWPKRCKLAHAFLWEYSYERLELAQLLGQLGGFLTLSLKSRPWPGVWTPERNRCLHTPSTPAAAIHLGVDVKVILTPPRICFIENHYDNIQGGVRMPLTSRAASTGRTAPPSSRWRWSTALRIIHER